MSDNESFDDLFNEFFANDGFKSIPPPTEEELRVEAMTATELHIVAFHAGVESGKDDYQGMLSAWLDELQYYLPVLEKHEEYEQCQKVVDTMRAIRVDSANITLNKELKELSIEHTLANTDHDEPDF